MRVVTDNDIFSSPTPVIPFIAYYDNDDNFMHNDKKWNPAQDLNDMQEVELRVIELGLARQYVTNLQAGACERQVEFLNDANQYSRWRCYKPEHYKQAIISLKDQIENAKEYKCQ